MKEESFTKDEKKIISKKIKDISLEVLEEDMNKLIKIGKQLNTISSRSNSLLSSNSIRASISFLVNLDTFKKKKFIQTMLKYYEDVKNKNNTKHEYKVYKEVYNICISAINIMKPVNCMEIYTRYNAKKVLNFCAGWGGSTIAASALNLEAHYGIEINNNLKESYEKMLLYLRTKSNTNLGMWFCDAALFDYATIDYDTIFSSPPYYFIEKYPNNITYSSKKEMDDKFYKPVFTKSYLHLKVGGHFIINVCKEVYDNVLKNLFGDANEIFPLKKSKRQNNYTELVYVWIKT